MDDLTTQRLGGLSKRQLIAAIAEITTKCGRDSAATNALVAFLDTIPKPLGSNAQPMKSSGSEDKDGDVMIEEEDQKQVAKKDRSAAGFDLAK